MAVLILAVLIIIIKGCCVFPNDNAIIITVLNDEIPVC
jgi:hypothetical protein